MITGLRSHQLRKGDIATRSGVARGKCPNWPLWMIVLSDPLVDHTHGVTRATYISWTPTLGWSVVPYTPMPIGTVNLWTVYNRDD